MPCHQRCPQGAGGLPQAPVSRSPPAHKAKPPPLRFRKALHKPALGCKAVDVGRVYIYNDALIRHAHVDDRPVYHMMAHKEYVPGLELICSAFHRVVYSSRDQHNYLVKFMKMKIQLLTSRVSEVEHTEIFIQIAFPAVFVPFRHFSASVLFHDGIIQHFLQCFKHYRQFTW